MSNSRRKMALARVLTAIGVAYAGLANADLLRPGQSLGVNERFNADGGSCYMTLNGDGNLTIARRDGRVVWETGTRGSGAARAIMQHDGNFVLYTANGAPVWSTSTQGPNRVFGIEYTGRAVVIMPWKGIKPDIYAQARTIPELTAGGGKYQWRTYPNPYL